MASAIDFLSFATIFCSICYKICYKLQKDKMAIALATEHLETNALQFWKWEKKWIYKSDTFNTLSDTERKKWKKSSFNNTNYQEILSKCLQRRFRHLETFTLPKSSWAYQEMCNKTTPYEKLNIEIDNAPPGSNPRGTRKITVFYAWKKKKTSIKVMQSVIVRNIFTNISQENSRLQGFHEFSMPVFSKRLGINFVQ